MGGSRLVNLKKGVFVETAEMLGLLYACARMSYCSVDMVTFPPLWFGFILITNLHVYMHPSNKRVSHAATEARLTVIFYLLLSSTHSCNS